MSQMEQIAQLLNLLGFSINHEKSQLNPTQQIQFLGFQIDSHDPMIRLTQEKVEWLVKTCKAVKQSNLSAGPCKAHRENDSYYPSNLPGSAEVSESTETEDPGSAQLAILRNHSQPESGGPIGTRVVGNIHAISEWEKYFVSGSTFDDGVRCFPAGLGHSV